QRFSLHQTLQLPPLNKNKPENTRFPQPKQHPNLPGENPKQKPQPLSCIQKHHPNTLQNAIPKETRGGSTLLQLKQLKIVNLNRRLKTPSKNSKHSRTKWLKPSHGDFRQYFYKALVNSIRKVLAGNGKARFKLLWKI
ncbi:hypothetical protein DRO44_01385, partial [Candidatus Bathyarchaeota archaeon]